MVAEDRNLQNKVQLQSFAGERELRLRFGDAVGGGQIFVQQISAFDGKLAFLTTNDLQVLLSHDVDSPQVLLYLTFFYVRSTADSIPMKDFKIISF